MASEMGPRVCRRGLVASTPPIQWSGEWRASKTVWPREGADVERRLGEDTWQVSARVVELLQVMNLLLLNALVQVFVLRKAPLKVSEVLFLSSPLTRPQTTLP